MIYSGLTRVSEATREYSNPEGLGAAMMVSGGFTTSMH